MYYKKKLFVTGIISLIMVLMTAASFGQGTAPTDSDGDSKLEISTKDHLLYLSENSNADWSADYEQTAHITFEASDFESGGDFYNDGSGFSPIGNEATEFTGSYDGQEYTIDNLYINRGATDYIGMFGMTYGSTIENLGMTNVDITGSWGVGGLIGATDLSSTDNCYSTGSVYSTGSFFGSFTGGLLGTISECTVSNCYSTSSVSGTDFIGGLVAGNYTGSIISDCYSTGSVTGNDYIGGLVAGNYDTNSTISNSYSTGSVSGSSFVGGLVGDNHSSAIVEESYSTGSVSGSSKTGGLIGENYTSTVSSCYSISSVIGNSKTGGLVGNNYSSSTISNSYSTGDVTRNSIGSTNLGGFCGENNGSTIEYCYSIGSVFSSPGTDWNEGGNADKGFVGNEIGTNTYTDNFFDSEASNQTDPNPSGFISATAKTTSEMKTESTFTNAGWDFIVEWDMDSSQYDGYPFLMWQPFQYSGPSNDSDNNLMLYIVEPAEVPSVSFFNTAPIPGTLPDGIAHISSYYWDITGMDDFTSAYISIPIADLSGVSDPSTLVWLKRESSGGAWEDIGGNIVDGNLECDKIYRFSEFAIGSETGDNPLPVELQDFHAEVIHGGIQLHWSTASEMNNKGFIVYKQSQQASLLPCSDLIEGAGTTSEPQQYSFTDKDVQPNILYTYQIADIEEGTNNEILHPPITIMATKEALQAKEIPEAYKLHANYPNPFNPTTTIEFDVPVASQHAVTLRIYDSSGKLVKTLIDEPMDAGKYSVSWHGNDDSGNAVSSGVYYCKMVTEKYSDVMQLVLLK